MMYAEGSDMIDRAHAEATTYRAAVCALTYTASKPVDEPGWTLDEDLDWCLAPLADMPGLDLPALRAQLAAAITDPTAHRARLLASLDALVDE